MQPDRLSLAPPILIDDVCFPRAADIAATYGEAVPVTTVSKDAVAT